MGFDVLWWLQYINIGLILKLVYYAIWCAVVATIYQYFPLTVFSVKLRTLTLKLIKASLPMTHQKHDTKHPPDTFQYTECHSNCFGCSGS
jgi:hypothetical protein